MPRPVRPWFRFYCEAVTSDRKLRRLRPAQRWLWVAILAAARQSPVAGVLLIAEGQPMDDRDLSDVAAMPAREIRATLPAFEEAGMLDHDPETGAWRVRNWNERQFETDDVTARTRRHKERRSEALGTPTERSHIKGRNVPKLKVGTPPETETETENRGKTLGEKPARQRPPNPIWDSLVEAFGEPATSSERSLLGKVAAELKPLGPAEEIAAQVGPRVEEARRRWNKPFGPNALVKHWTDLGRPQIAGLSGGQRAAMNVVRTLEGGDRGSDAGGEGHRAAGGLLPSG